MAKDLEEKRETFLKKLKKLGRQLRALEEHHRKEADKLRSKTASYEAKLKKIDDRLKGI